MNNKKLNQRLKQEDEIDQVKQHKARKKQLQVEDILDEDELSDEVLDYLKRHMK